MTTIKAWAILIENIDGEGSNAVPRVYTDESHAKRMVGEIAKTLAADTGRIAARQEGHDTETWIVFAEGFEEEPSDDDYCRFVYIVETKLIEDKTD